MDQDQLKHFLIFFDRSQGEIVRMDVFDEDQADEAAAAYTAAEQDHAHEIHGSNPDLEIVLLGAESEQTLMQTHAHYFAKSGDRKARFDRLSRRVNELAGI